MGILGAGVGLLVGVKVAVMGRSCRISGGFGTADWRLAMDVSVAPTSTGRLRVGVGKLHARASAIRMPGRNKIFRFNFNSSSHDPNQKVFLPKTG
jgi:hypothetical protein